MRQNTGGVRRQTPDGKITDPHIRAYSRYRNSIVRTIQYRRQERFGQGMVQAIYGKSNIPSSKIAERFIQIYGIPEER